MFLYVSFYEKMNLLLDMYGGPQGRQTHPRRKLLHDNKNYSFRSHSILRFFILTFLKLIPSDETLLRTLISGHSEMALAEDLD